jgi:D-alanyl-D-alanine carboxypeptidase
LPSPSPGSWERALTHPFLVSLLALALSPFQFSIQPLPAPVRAEVRATAWHPGCPVPLSGLRLLTVSYRGFDGRMYTGQLVVNRSAAAPLARVFGQLYRIGFPIRHMSVSDAYGPKGSRPADGDVSASFECRQAVPSPCVGGRGTGSWSEHAFGEAVDLNPLENPYVGCGQSRDPASRPYFDRSRHRPGMVTPAVVRAFRSIGWGWGGSWSGSTKDYMHFSASGH